MVERVFVLRDAEGPVTAQSLIEVLELTNRIRHVLWSDNIATVAQLASLSRAELLRMPNFGMASLRIVEAALAKHAFAVGSPPCHAYPREFLPGQYWATDEAWKILDWLPVGRLDDDERFYLATLIAGALERVSTYYPGSPGFRGEALPAQEKQAR